jgi:hypothetical protein
MLYQLLNIKNVYSYFLNMKHLIIFGIRNFHQKKELFKIYLKEVLSIGSFLKKMWKILLEKNNSDTWLKFYFFLFPLVLSTIKRFFQENFPNMNKLLKLLKKGSIVHFGNLLWKDCKILKKILFNFIIKFFSVRTLFCTQNWVFKNRLPERNYLFYIFKIKRPALNSIHYMISIEKIPFFLSLNRAKKIFLFGLDKEKRIEINQLKKYGKKINFLDDFIDFLGVKFLEKYFPKKNTFIFFFEILKFHDEYKLKKNFIKFSQKKIKNEKDKISCPNDHFKFSSWNKRSFFKFFGQNSFSNFIKLFSSFFLFFVDVKKEKSVFLFQNFNPNKKTQTRDFFLERTIFFMNSEFYNFLNIFLNKLIFDSLANFYENINAKKTPSIFFLFKKMTKKFFFFQKYSIHVLKSFFRTFPIIQLFKKIELKKEEGKSKKKNSVYKKKIFLTKKELKKQNRLIYFIKNEFEMRMIPFVYMIKGIKNLESGSGIFCHDLTSMEKTRI